MANNIIDLSHLSEEEISGSSKKEPLDMSNLSEDEILGNIKQDNKSDISQIESGLRGAAEGATLGFADELYGAGGAGKEALTGNVSNIQDLVNQYTQYRDSARKAQEEARLANPNSFMAGEVASSFVPGGAIASTLKGLKGVSKAAALGGSLSGITNVGKSEELDANTLPNAAESAMAGATIGAGLSQVGPKLGTAIGAGLGYSNIESDDSSLEALGKTAGGAALGLGIGKSNVAEGTANLGLNKFSDELKNRSEVARNLSKLFERSKETGKYYGGGEESPIGKLISEDVRKASTTLLDTTRDLKSQANKIYNEISTANNIPDREKAVEMLNKIRTEFSSNPISTTDVEFKDKILGELDDLILGKMKDSNVSSPISLKDIRNVSENIEKYGSKFPEAYDVSGKLRKSIPELAGENKDKLLEANKLYETSQKIPEQLKKNTESFLKNYDVNDLNSKQVLDKLIKKSATDAPTKELLDQSISYIEQVDKGKAAMIRDAISNSQKDVEANKIASGLVDVTTPGANVVTRQIIQGAGAPIASSLGVISKKIESFEPTMGSNISNTVDRKSVV